MRVTQAERDQVAEQLSSAFADGRLNQAEFDTRMGAAMAARTHGELAPLLADLRPPGPAVPAPPEFARVTAGERMWGMTSHLATLLLSFIGPLLVLVTKGQESRYVRDHALESLNFQLTFLAANVGLVFVTVLTFGLAALLYIPLGLAWFVLVLIGTVAGLSGNLHRYPLTIRLVR